MYILLAFGVECATTNATFMAFNCREGITLGLFTLTHNQFYQNSLYWWVVLSANIFFKSALTNRHFKSSHTLSQQAEFARKSEKIIPLLYVGYAFQVGCQYPGVYPQFKTISQIVWVLRFTPWIISMAMLALGQCLRLYFKSSLFPK